jgi:hypothetical protein
MSQALSGRRRGLSGYHVIKLPSDAPVGEHGVRNLQSQRIRSATRHKLNRQNERLAHLSQGQPLRLVRQRGL